MQPSPAEIQRLRQAASRQTFPNGLDRLMVIQAIRMKQEQNPDLRNESAKEAVLTFLGHLHSKLFDYTIASLAARGDGPLTREVVLDWCQRNLGYDPNSFEPATSWPGPLYLKMRPNQTARPFPLPDDHPCRQHEALVHLPFEAVIRAASARPTFDETWRPYESSVNEGREPTTSGMAEGTNADQQPDTGVFLEQRPARGSPGSMLEQDSSETPLRLDKAGDPNTSGMLSLTNMKAEESQATAAED